MKLIPNVVLHAWQGDYGRRTGWAVHFEEPKLASCAKCYKKMSDASITNDDMRTNNSPPCRQCSNFNMEDDCPEHLRSYPAHNNYPTKANHPNNAPKGREVGLVRLPAVHQSVEWMIKGIKFAYIEVFEGSWGKANIEEYMKTMNIKTSTMKSVYDAALYDRENNIPPNPSKVVPKLWELWDLFRAGRLPDTPMHQIGHGIGPDIMIVFHQILSHYGKMTQFYKWANKYVADIGSWRLDYCKLKDLPKAAWVAENTMGYMRIMPYLCGMYLMNHPFGDPDETAGTIHNIKCMLNAFHVLISCLMTMREVPISVIDANIKMFLASCHHLHTKYGKLNRKGKPAQSQTSGNYAGTSTMQGCENNGNTNVVLKSKQYFDMTYRQLVRVCTESNIDCTGTVDILVRRVVTVDLKKLTVTVLKARYTTLGAWGLSLSGIKKDELVNFILEYEMNNEVALLAIREAANQSKKGEKGFWIKGNFISLLNLPLQIELIGPLRLIW